MAVHEKKKRIFLNGPLSFWPIGAEVNYLHEILYAKLLLMDVSSISSTSQSSHGSKIATVSCK